MFSHPAIGAVITFVYVGTLYAIGGAVGGDGGLICIAFGFVGHASMVGDAVTKANKFNSRLSKKIDQYYSSNYLYPKSTKTSDLIATYFPIIQISF
jgi:hypothetical protein